MLNWRSACAMNCSNSSALTPHFLMMLQEALMTEEAERDLCSRVIAAIDDGNSMREAACRLSIAISTRMMASFSA